MSPGSNPTGHNCSGLLLPCHLADTSDPVSDCRNPAIDEKRFELDQQLNVYQMFVAQGGPGFWVGRTTWGGTCARVVAVGEFTVSFAEKDKAKAIGAKWDAGERVWWIPAGKHAVAEKARELGFL
jgi:hypothetical protein